MTAKSLKCADDEQLPAVGGSFTISMLLVYLQSSYLSVNGSSVDPVKLKWNVTRLLCCWGQIHSHQEYGSFVQLLNNRI